MDIVKRLKAKPPKGFVTSPLMIEAATEIERLREALQAVVNAHGTGQGIGAQGVGGWMDQARQALEQIKHSGDE